MLKKSKQRDCILEYVRSRKDHPTAEMVYTAIQEQFPRISLGTVYRNLSLLVSLGQLRRISFQEGPERFDGNTAPHYHFRCSCCGRISDLPMDTLDGLNQLAQNFCEDQILGHQTWFYGLCRDCAAQGEKPEDFDQNMVDKLR